MLASVYGYIVPRLYGEIVNIIVEFGEEMAKEA